MDHSHRPSYGNRPPRRVSEAGFTIIEVLVAALILAIVAAGSATAFVGAIGSSGQVRNRSAAEALAQQNENRLRGYNVDELSNLSKTLSPVTLDGTQYTVSESASYISDSSSQASCSNPSADYLQTTSTVSWTGIGAQAPVKVSSLLTPTIGSVSESNGSLLVSATDQNSNGIAGLNVSAVNGSNRVTGTTNAAGCVLFGDLPGGNYTVSVNPVSGSYVDHSTGKTVTAGSADVAPNAVTVVGGSSTPGNVSFTLAQPGSAAVSFTDAFPSGITPTSPPAGSYPAAVFSQTGLNSPSYVVCSASDVTCPAVGNPDTSFPVGDFTSAFNAASLYPFSTPYSTYAGVCSSDNPANFGGSAVPVTVAPNATATDHITLPSIVLRLWYGNPGNSSDFELTPGAYGLDYTVNLTDTGCGVQYIGYTSSPPAVSSGQAALGLNLSYTSGDSGQVPTDAGLIASPGMPYGTYKACLIAQYGGQSFYDSKVYLGSSNSAATAFTNSGSGEIINMYTSDAGTSC